MEKKMFFSFIIFQLYHICLNYFVFPFNVTKYDKIENLISFNSTYTTIEMGTPPQKVHFYYYINENKMYLTDIGCQKDNLYNISTSSSQIILGEPDKDNPNNRVVLFESLLFINNTNLSQTMEMDQYPLLVKSNFDEDLFNKGMCGFIGLSIMQNEKYDSEPEEFDYYMKYLIIFNSNFSFLHYNGQDMFINSIILNEELKEYFKDIKNISWINPKLRDGQFHWEINMKEIYYNKVHFRNIIIIELTPLFELIQGTNEYKTSIQNDYFNSFINNKICSIIEVGEYNIFECDANKFGINDIKKFPTLHMINIDISFIFEFVGEELFYKLNDKYYFKIIFPFKDFEPSRWIVGRTFLRKYPTTFCPSNRIIGFYINPIDINIEVEDDDEKSWYSNKIVFYIIIIIIALIFTGFGIYIGKKIFFQKKRKANELIDDNYEYAAKDIKDTNIN
jgi:hypothetical protein